MSFIVRNAEEEDVNEIVREMKNACEFYPSRRSLFKDDMTSYMIVRRMMNEHVLLVAYDTSDYDFAGFICGAIAPHYLNPDIRVLFGVSWWVSEKYRNTRCASLLLNKYIEWGKENVDWLTLQIPEESPMRDSSLIKKNFKIHERSFVMEVC